MNVDDIVTVETRLTVRNHRGEVLFSSCLDSGPLKMGSISYVSSLKNADIPKTITGFLTRLHAAVESLLQSSSEPAGPLLLTTYENIDPAISLRLETLPLDTSQTMES